VRSSNHRFGRANEFVVSKSHRQWPKLEHARGWILCLAVGLSCVVATNAVPWISELLVALIIGVVAANLPITHLRVAVSHADTLTGARALLRVGVVMLGFRLPIGDIVAIGLPGVTVIIATVTLTYQMTCILGDRLGLNRGLVTLIASGFAVCGAAAIAAVEGNVRRRDQDPALAIAMVTIFGTLMMVGVPIVASQLTLSDRQLGVWAGASIHEVGQVVAAASSAGAVAVAVATTVKLGRVALLSVVYMAALKRDGRRPVNPDVSSPPLMPWFVWGFVLAVVIRSAGFLPDEVLNHIDSLTTTCLAAGMFGLGLEIRVASLFPLPLRVLWLSAASTVVAASVAGGLTVMLV